MESVLYLALNAPLFPNPWVLLVIPHRTSNTGVNISQSEGIETEVR